jgi:transposase
MCGMAALSNQPLPDDIEALKALVLQGEIERQAQAECLAKQQQRIELLHEQIRLLTHKRFGASSEKSDQQAELFNEPEAAEETAAKAVEAATETVTYQCRKRSGRKPLPEDLPRVRIEHDLAEADKVCACGCALTAIGEDTSEQLDIIPATVRVLVHARKKYACKGCEAMVRTAPLPAQPIPKSNASPGLLAYIATAKYQDALPLHRQEHIFRRIGVDLPRNTLAHWILRCGELIAPITAALNRQLLQGAIIQCDETPVQVLKEPDKPPTSHSYMWVRVGGDRHRPIVLYDYAPSRAGAVADRLLEGFSGHLQTDDYAGYHAVGSRHSVRHLGCWAHARRKFVEAQKANTGKSDHPKPGRTSKADMALNYIGKLYAVEREAKEATAHERQQLREQNSKPVLDQLRQWLDKTLHTTVPKGLLGKALGYLDRNWDKLVVYLDDGGLAIDNNRAENAIRPFVIGRKNWLFSDTPRGAHASAALYGLIETAKANGLEPYGYLREIFTKLPTATTYEAIAELLPWNIDLGKGVVD